jgi:hypothetical protein
MVLKLPLRIGYGITGMIFTIVYNIIFTILLKIINHENMNTKNIIITIYYLQCNSCLVFLFYANRIIQAA